MAFLLLSSGFFLGWSLGANDGGNIFGTAVTTRMLRFNFAAIIASIFVILGAVFQGTGATQTISSLGAINEISGSFTVAIAAALSLFLMLKIKIPVSSSQAVVGAILGWNLFSSYFTDSNTLIKIVSTWFITPVLSAGLSILFFYFFKMFFKKKSISLLYLDYYTRIGFIILIAFSAYSLGANNIANVMGMFVKSSPFTPITLFNKITITGFMQLFFLGGLSIAAGILTKSNHNVQTVGKTIFKMSPMTGFIAILSSSIVLFMFSSKTLQIFLVKLHFPTLPLVPVSSSQAIVGAIIGLGIAKGAKNIQYKNFFKITLGWIANPILAGIICFISLFFMQNVFDQNVFQPTKYVYSVKVMNKLKYTKINIDKLSIINGKTFYSSKQLKEELDKIPNLSFNTKTKVANYGKYKPMFVSQKALTIIKNRNYFSELMFSPLLILSNYHFEYEWELVEALSELSPLWQYKPQRLKNDFYNSELDTNYNLLYDLFKIEEK